MLPHSIGPARLNDLDDPQDVVAGRANRVGGHLVDERPRHAGRPFGVELDAAGEHLSEIVSASLCSRGDGSARA